MTLHINGTNYVSDSSSDDEEDEEVMYEPDETSPTKYNIVLCELHNEKIHGKSRKELLNHYFVIGMFKKLDMIYLREMSSFYKDSYAEKVNKITPHSVIRNYTNIILNSNYIKPEIAHCIYLAGGEQVCILKTFWLRIIQRTWKKIYKIRIDIINRRRNPRAVLNRQMNNGYSEYFPSLRGMLHSGAFGAPS